MFPHSASPSSSHAPPRPPSPPPPTQVVGGIFAHSLAIITDAAHLLSDVSGFAVAVLAAYWAKRRSHEHFSYGYHRVEVGRFERRGREERERGRAWLFGPGGRGVGSWGRLLGRPAPRLARSHPSPACLTLPSSVPPAGAGRAGLGHDCVACHRRPAV